MNTITLKPYLFFWILSPVFFMIGYLSDKNTFDINIHDTYYVVEQGFVNTALSVFCAITGLGYWFVIRLSGKLLKWLTIIHILSVIIGVFFIGILPQFFLKPTTKITNYLFYENMDYCSFIIAIIILFVQILYPINLVIGLLRKTNN